MNTKKVNYYFDFVSAKEKDNFEFLQHLTSVIHPSCVESAEKLFNIKFASGIENDRPVFLNFDGEDINNDYLMNKYDGKVLLTTPPLDHQTNKAFTKNKLTFKIETREIGNGFVEVKGYINSKFRNSLEF